MQENQQTEGFSYAPAEKPAEFSDQQAPQTKQTSQESFTWEASEFVDHQKSALWFLVLLAGSFILAAVVYFITRDILSTLVILIATIAFAMFAGKKPRTLSYSLLPSTLKIDQKTYSYDDFRSFSVIQEGALFSVILEPVKRFMPPLTIYFAEDDGEKIFDALATHLPHEERGLDFVDKLMRKIRF